MAKNTYQTYTDDTPIASYRSDFLRRAAMCNALSKRLPGLGPIGAQAAGHFNEIDARLLALRQAEDDQVRARALEDAEKLDVIDVYTEMRRTMAIKGDSYLTILPDAPSTLGRLGVKNFVDRVAQAIANMTQLPDDDAVKVAFLPRLQKEAEELQDADKAEDVTRAALRGGRTALTLYKSELSLAREKQLGALQQLLGDREKAAQFTLPWRKWSKGDGEELEDGAGEAPGGAPSP